MISSSADLRFCPGTGFELSLEDSFDVPGAESAEDGRTLKIIKCN